MTAAPVVRGKILKVYPGVRIGQRTVLTFQQNKRVTVRCDCGREDIVYASSLGTGKADHCKNCKQIRQHLQHLTNEVYGRLWHRAKDAIGRCTDNSHRQWARYGGRGITVHTPWITDHLLFIEYMATLPGFDVHNLVLDRANNNGNYEPGNL